MSDSSRRSPLRVPERGNPDRKRALNVLAQRRYRQRKRERIGLLERKVMEAGLVEAQSRKDDSSSETPPSPEKEPQSLQNDFAVNWSHFPLLQESESLESNSMLSQPMDTWYNVTNQSLVAINSCSSTSPYGLDDSSFLGFLSNSPLNSAPPTPFLPSDSTLSTSLQTLESLQFTFPDDASLAIPELKIMKAGLAIAQMLGVAHNIWDPSISRTFNPDLRAPLPAHLHPTPIQKVIPHHPLFDILPWPSVRTKFICAFAQPPDLRPPAARDPMALMHMIYDLDDTAEGVRISGEDGLDAGNWEVGQVFFRNWWWALDREIVENSNALRARRGAGRLRLMPD